MCFPVVFQWLGLRRVFGERSITALATSLKTGSFCLLRQLLQPLRMFPALAQSSSAQWYQHTNSKHKGIAVCFLSWLVDEGADACVVAVVDEVSFVLSTLPLVGLEESYMRSSCTLCNPDGRLLYSTLSFSSTSSHQQRPSRRHGRTNIRPGIDSFQAIVYLPNAQLLPNFVLSSSKLTQL